ncbi:MAG: glycosyltransferase, partial [Candidatus Zixiibacteriota bacterium]
LYLTYIFFKLCKLVGLTVRITCHDVSSHYLGMNNIRARILVQADELVVHNDAAVRTICENLGKSIKDKIKTYSFPFSAYDEIISAHKLDSARTRLRHSIGSNYYLFLGVVRRSKGIEMLIQAWSLFNKGKNERLVIAGKWTDPDKKFRKLAEDDETITVMDRYLDDEEFVQLITDAKFVVLPYLEYAHSSVIISCGNHGGAVIISDIQLFQQIMPNYRYTFKQGSVSGLVDALNKTSDLTQAQIDGCHQELKLAVQLQHDHLVEDLREAYGSK